jgi:hypothetical protein
VTGSEKMVIRLIITGAPGQLGRLVVAALLGDVHPCPARGSRRAPLPPTRAGDDARHRNHPVTSSPRPPGANRSGLEDNAPQAPSQGSASDAGTAAAVMVAARYPAAFTGTA